MNKITIKFPHETKGLNDLSPENKSFAFDYIEEKILSFDPSQNKIYRHIGGIPGSGKTTHAKKLLKESNALFISFDDIMENMPSYKKDKDLGVSNQNAYINNVQDARAIGHALLQKAISYDLNIIFEHSLTKIDHINMIKNIKNMGYTTHLYHIDCDVNTAEERVKEREKITNRNVPTELIYEREKTQKEMLPLYKETIDKYFKINT